MKKKCVRNIFRLFQCGRCIRKNAPENALHADYAHTTLVCVHILEQNMPIHVHQLFVNNFTLFSLTRGIYFYCQQEYDTIFFPTLDPKICQLIHPIHHAAHHATYYIADIYYIHYLHLNPNPGG